MRQKLETHTFILLTTLGMVVCAVGLALLRAKARAQAARTHLAGFAQRLRAANGGFTAWSAARGLAIGASSACVALLASWRLLER